MASARSKSGGVLLSHILSGAVPSALSGLTSGFGMGPGVSRLAMAAVTACQPFIQLCRTCVRIRVVGWELGSGRVQCFAVRSPAGLMPGVCACLVGVCEGKPSAY